MTVPVQRWTLASHHTQSVVTVSVLAGQEGPAVLVEVPGRAAHMLVGPPAARWLDATGALASVCDPIGGGGASVSPPTTIT